MGRNAVVIILMNLCYGCVFCQSDTSAYLYKLNYDVPESPALSIIDANPAKVMRGSASKEFAVNLIKNFATKNRQETGLAIDFNPYFILGGQLKNATEYDDNYLKRVLANTQFSVASVYSDEMPDDNMLSGGVRITLWDDFDLLSDATLRQDIDRALIPSDEDMEGGFSDSDESGNGTLITIPTLTQAYERAKQRLKDRRGFALSLGLATAKLLRGGILDGDSLMAFRNQVWNLYLAKNLLFNLVLILTFHWPREFGQMLA